MPTKDLVAEFKKKVQEVNKKEGVRIKVEGLYKDALEKNRLDKRWHPAGKLAVVTFDDGKKVVIEIRGAVKGEVLDPSGTICGMFKKTVEEVDELIAEDKALKKCLAGKDDEYYIELATDNEVVAYLEGDEAYTVTLNDNIAKAIFEVSKYRSLTNQPEQMELEQEPEPKPEIKAEPEPEPEPEAEPEPVKEEVFEEPEPVEEEIPEEPEPVEAEEKPEPEPEKKPAPKKTQKTKKNIDTNIEDSGDRTEFESGAVRDIAVGKGRCDLLPLDIVDLFMTEETKGSFLGHIQLFKDNGNPFDLVDAAKAFSKEYFPDDITAILEWSVHMENGARKYGDDNWTKGIPLNRYVDSAIRHYLKCLRGDDDERHDRAVIWNCLCGAWTAVHKPELNCYEKKSR